MRLSLYEIETILRKASIGAGLPLGLAQDCGQAGAWLAAHGFDGVAAVLNAIHGGMQNPATPTIDGDTLVFSNAPVAICGPSVIDLLIAFERIEIRLENADVPMLLFGMAGVAARQYRRGFSFDLGVASSASVTAEGFTLHEPNPLPGETITIKSVPVNSILAKSLPAGIASNKTITQTFGAGIGGVVADDTLWQEALALAAKTYVPASDTSRTAGAGAGLTDND